MPHNHFASQQAPQVLAQGIQRQRVQPQRGGQPGHVPPAVVLRHAGVAEGVAERGAAGVQHAHFDWQLHPPAAADERGAFDIKRHQALHLLLQPRAERGTRGWQVALYCRFCRPSIWQVPCAC